MRTLLVALTLLVLPAPALALVRAEPLSLPALAARASLVVTARVTAARVLWNDTHDLLVTEYEATPLREWKSAGDSRVPFTFRVPGGELGTVGLIVPGVPHIEAGHTYVLALRFGADGVLELAAPADGAWLVRGEDVEGLGVTLEQLGGALSGECAISRAASAERMVPELRTATGALLRWPGPTPGATFLVHPAPPAGVATSEAWLAEVRAAVASWNEVRMGFCFDEAGTTELGATAPQPDGFNVIRAGNAQGALARTTVWYVPKTGRILESDVVIDDGSSTAWAHDANGAARSRAGDRTAVLRHELGHFLGLAALAGDSDTQAMSDAGAREGLASGLGDADVNGAQALYGSRDLQCPLLAYEPDPTIARSTALSALMTAGPGTVRFTLQRAGKVSAGVYDLAGRLVYNFPTLFLDAGTHTLRWGGQLGDGGAQRGIYFVRVRLDGGSAAAHKMVWTR